MRGDRRVGAVLAALVVAGCNAELTDEGSQVEAANSAPSSQGFDSRNCENLGFLTGSGQGMFSTSQDRVNAAMNDLRNQAAQLGANYIHYDTPQLSVTVNTTVTSRVAHTSVGNGGATISGTAYRCSGPVPQDNAVARAPEPARAAGPANVKPPVGAAGFAFGAKPEDAQAACEAKYVWSSLGPDTFACSGTPHTIGAEAGAWLKFCEGWLCKASFTMRPDSEASGEWIRKLVELKTTLQDRYGAPVEDNVVPFSCGDDLLPCVRKGTAHVIYRWRFSNLTTITLGLTNKPGPDAAIGLTYTAAKPADIPAL